jgi:hypothetical protein
MTNLGAAPVAGMMMGRPDPVAAAAVATTRQALAAMAEAFEGERRYLKVFGLSPYSYKACAVVLTAVMVPGIPTDMPTQGLALTVADVQSMLAVSSVLVFTQSPHVFSFVVPSKGTRSACRVSQVTNHGIHLMRCSLHTNYALLCSAGQLSYCSFVTGSSANMVVITGPPISSQDLAAAPQQLRHLLKLSWEPWKAAQS